MASSEVFLISSSSSSSSESEQEPEIASSPSTTGPSRSTSLRYHGHVIGERDIDLLGPEQRLNDNLIDFFLSLFTGAIAQNSAYAFSTFFYSQLTQKSLQIGWERVKNWTKNVDIFAHDLLLFPINEANQHWWLIAVIRPKALARAINGLPNLGAEGCLVALDSRSCEIIEEKKLLRSLQRKAAAAVVWYLGKAFAEANGPGQQKVDKKSITRLLNLSGIFPENSPKQMNEFDCGMFLLEFAKRLCSERQKLAIEPELTEERLTELGILRFGQATVKRRRRFIKKLCNRWGARGSVEEDIGEEGGRQALMNAMGISCEPPRPKDGFTERLLAERKRKKKLEVSERAAPVERDGAVGSYEEADALRVQSAFNTQGREMMEGSIEGSKGAGRAQPLLNYMPVGEWGEDEGAIDMGGKEERTEGAAATPLLTSDEAKVREEELKKISERPTPWSLMEKEQHRNPVLRLHEEIWAFAEHYLLTPKDTRVEACLRADQPSTTSSKKWTTVRPCGLYSLGIGNLLERDGFCIELYVENIPKLYSKGGKAVVRGGAAAAGGAGQGTAGSGGDRASEGMMACAARLVSHLSEAGLLVDSNEKKDKVTVVKCGSILTTGILCPVIYFTTTAPGGLRCAIWLNSDEADGVTRVTKKNISEYPALLPLFAVNSAYLTQAGLLAHDGRAQCLDNYSLISLINTFLRDQERSASQELTKSTAAFGDNSKPAFTSMSLGDLLWEFAKSYSREIDENGEEGADDGNLRRSSKRQWLLPWLENLIDLTDQLSNFKETKAAFECMYATLKHLLRSPEIRQERNRSLLVPYLLDSPPDRTATVRGSKAWKEYGRGRELGGRGLTDYYRDETRRRFSEVIKIRSNLDEEMKLRMNHPSMATWWSSNNAPTEPSRKRGREESRGPPSKKQASGGK
ncbi:hypothetical protein FOZ60_005991 [Perkinsus olseni]|uniref:Ubiquitin-like protease family profile domain-containing protein n=1 Tax=Perkinsus olseni TaxID=32597 RepID=A0A7J6NPT3_PEROL|nr:hypothetical protein FOZ60_005991 [Perkinsus olseni]